MELLKANQSLRALRTDDAGVSPVIGAILVFGLASTAFMLWSVTSLPEWIADNEQARNEQVEARFASLVSGLDGLSASGDAGPITATVPLGAQEVPLMQPAPSLASLRVEAGTAWTGLFNGTTTHLQDGDVLGVPQEPMPSSIAAAYSLSALEVAVSSSGVGDGDAAQITVLAYDGNENITLTYGHVGRDVLPAGDPCKNEGGIQYGVESSVIGAIVAPQTIICTNLLDSVNHQLDALDLQYRFATSLDRLTAPFALTFAEVTSGGASVTGTFGAGWDDAAGRPQIIGTGVATGDIAQDASGSRLIFDPVSLHNVDQDIVWEAGGILLAQAAGGAVARSPDFQLTVDGTVGHLRWTVVDMGGNGEISGAGTATARVTHTRTQEWLLSADTASIDLATSYADAWESFLEKKILAAGTVDAATGRSGDTVQISLTDSVVTEWRVHLRIIHADVVVS